ncbi:MAG: LacI family DNA-binding transcriptional regulator, partial [Gammaproteobacteria bacterium]|nr:LacI family DNA-binding transcriptional regulator [Gammaproteobacteria bacterium]
GDGSLTAPTPRFTTADARIARDFAGFADELGLDVSVTSRDRSAPTYRLKRRRGPSQADVAAVARVSTATVSLALGRSSHRLADATVEKVREAGQLLGYENEGSQPQNPFMRRLEEHGLTGTTSHTKFVPPAVFRLPERQLALFLSRLYATDGSAWTHGNIYRIEYSTVSERFARDLQHLLLRFGISAKLRRRVVRYRSARRVAWDISIQDPASVQRFAKRIGIFSKERQLKAVV